MFFQQGDVILAKVAEIKGKKLSHLILATGEITGHCHEITKGNAGLYEHEGTLFLKVLSNTAELTHQEHKTIVLPQGDYEVKRVQEKDWVSEEIRQVQD